MQKRLIKNNLKDIRLSFNLTLFDVASALGTSASHIKDIESRCIEKKMFFKYVSFLIEKEVSIEKIFTDEQRNE